MMLDKDRVHHKRSIYTFWDFLGDVGGLFDMLKILAKPVLVIAHVLLGTGLDQYLLSSIFKVQKKMKSGHTLQDYIKRRQPFKASFCNVLFDRHNRKLQKYAQ